MQGVVSSDRDSGVDSPTYDGDVESSTTVYVGGGHTGHTFGGASLGSVGRTLLGASSSTSTLTSPITSNFPTSGETSTGSFTPAQSQSTTDVVNPNTSALVSSGHGGPGPSTSAEFDPSRLTADEIQLYIRNAIAGVHESGVPPRTYRINPPPIGRPVRIYADGRQKAPILRL